MSPEFTEINQYTVLLYLVRNRKPPISSIAALGSNFNPRNT
jgi:hypothetical protein